MDEYERVFDLWNDVSYIRSYLKQNIQYLKTDFFVDRSIDSPANQVLLEGRDMQKLIYEYVEAGFQSKGDRLEMIFKPLGKQAVVPMHQFSKARIEHKKRFPKPILRMYATRLGPNSFVISGGVVKLVREMKDHPDTVKELEKLDSVRNYLTGLGIQNDEDLIYYYEQS